MHAQPLGVYQERQQPANATHDALHMLKSACNDLTPRAHEALGYEAQGLQLRGTAACDKSDNDAAVVVSKREAAATVLDMHVLAYEY